jgi:hypothetical protein
MIHSFEVLYKCDSVSYNDALDDVTIFIVNTSEAMRDKEIYKEIEDSFDMFLDKLNSEWDQNSGRAPLFANLYLLTLKVMYSTHVSIWHMLIA